MIRLLTLMLSCAMSRAWCGREVVPMRSERNVVMMKFVVEVRGPSQSVQSGSWALGSKWFRTLQPRRWGSFWMRHCEKRWSLVCGLVMT